MTKEKRSLLDYLINGVVKIIVHAGKAHRDEIIACAFFHALRYFAQKKGEDGKFKDIDLLPIYRRNYVHPQEIDNPRILVMDIGRCHDLSKMCFDHHQLPTEQIDCAFSLLLKDFCVYESSKEIFGWLDDLRILDARGPYYLASQHNSNPDFVQSLLNDPIARALISKINEQKEGEERNEYFDFLVRIVADGFIKKIKTCLETLPNVKLTKIDCCKDKELFVADLRQYDPAVSGTLSEVLARKYKETLAVVVSKSERDGSWVFCRANNFAEKFFDFRGVMDEPYCTFAHNNGFLCTTKADVDIQEVLADTFKNEIS